MDPEVLGQLFTTFGFPTATAVFLLWWVTMKLNGRLERLAQALDDLPDKLADRLADRIASLLMEARRGD